jgi:hypothetical protein
MKVKIISDGEWDLGHTLNHVSVYSTCVYSWVSLHFAFSLRFLLLVADLFRLTFLVFIDGGNINVITVCFPVYSLKINA